MPGRSPRSPPAGRRAGRDRAGARARAAPLATRRSRSGRRARARHAARHHHPVAKELASRSSPDCRACRRRRLLNEQAQRCRAILAQAHRALQRRSIRPHEAFDADRGGRRAAPQFRCRDRRRLGRGRRRTDRRRNPAMLYGLGNLLENAVDFARGQVEVTARWNGTTFAVTITDDGPGFAPEIMERIGEPYVTSRRRATASMTTRVDSRRADWVWDFSSPRPCSSARARRSRSRTGPSRARRGRAGALGPQRLRAPMAFAPEQVAIDQS